MKISHGLVLLLVLIQCKSDPDPPEPTRGKFFIENRSSWALSIDAMYNYPGGGPWDLLTDLVCPNTTEHFFNAFNPYGGKISPSVFF